MKELLDALDEFLTALAIYERQHTEQTRRLMERKRSVLNHVRVKYQKIRAQVEQPALFAPAATER